MDKIEAQTRLKGADDLILLLEKIFDEMHRMNGKKMTDDDKEDFNNLLGSCRNILEESYKRKVSFFESVK